MIQAHANAVLALLAAAAAGSPPLVVVDGHVPQGTLPPYVLAYFADTDPATGRSLSGESKRYLLRIYLHCVGGDQTAARAVSQRARAALLDVVASVAGRTCFPIRREDGQPPQPDETTGVLVQDKVDIYRLESIPA